MTGIKVCKWCKQAKDLSNYHKDKSRYDGMSTECKACKRARHREWYKNNWIKISDKRKLKDYGLPLGAFAKMSEEQEDKCAICLETKPLRVDHCHKTGRIRKLLCDQCNIALGNLKDDPAIVQRAADYLNGFKYAEGMIPDEWFAGL